MGRKKKAGMLRCRRRLALFLVLSMIIGFLPANSGLAASSPAVRTSLDGEITPGATKALAEKAFKDTALYGLDPSKSYKLDDEGRMGPAIVDDEATTISNVRYVLATQLIEEIDGLLDEPFTNSMFQTHYRNVRFVKEAMLRTGEYKALEVWDKGVSQLTTKDRNQQIMTAYDYIRNLYDYAEKALQKIINAMNIPLSSETVYTFFNALIGSVKDGTVTKNEESAQAAVEKYTAWYDTISQHDLLVDLLLEGVSSNKEKNKYFLLEDFPKDQVWLEQFNFTYLDGGVEKTIPAKGNISGSKTYKKEYEDMLRIYELEFAYLEVLKVDGIKNYTTESTEPIRDVASRFTQSDGLYTVYKKMCGTTAAGGMGSQGDADSFIKTLYNGQAILALIHEYEDLMGFLNDLDVVSAMGNTSEKIIKAIEVQKKYDALTPSEKAKLSASDLALLKNIIPVTTSVSKVKQLIDAIAYPKNESEYKNTFLPSLRAAENEYNALLKLYPNTGIESFIDNRAKLTDIYKVYQNYQDRIYEALAIENESVCNKLSTVIEPLRNELLKLNQTKTDIYNHLLGCPTLEERYKDATTAKKLRQRVDALMMSPTSEDKTELNNIKTAVAALNKQAKAYFGSLYEQYIQALEYGTYTDDLNKANRVDTLISRIGTVTSSSGEKIKAAQTEYDALTPVQKSLVKNYPILVAAIKTYGELSKDIGYAFVSNVKKGYVYTHSAIQPNPVVKVGETTLTKDVHYSVSYSNNLNVGTGTVTITAITGSGYSGTFQKTFLIVKDSVENCGVTGLKKKYKWTGKFIKPNFTVTVNGYDIKKGSDYTVSYKNNKKPGKATITIKGIGNYSGSATRTFQIKKKKTKKKNKKKK